VPRARHEWRSDAGHRDRDWGGRRSDGGRSLDLGYGLGDGPGDGGRWLDLGSERCGPGASHRNSWEGAGQDGVLRLGEGGGGEGGGGAREAVLVEPGMGGPGGPLGHGGEEHDRGRRRSLEMRPCGVQARRRAAVEVGNESMKLGFLSIYTCSL
jgi:hypothetical protein